MTKDDKELKRLTELDDIRFLLGSEKGRRFLWRLLSDGGAFTSCFDGSSNTFYRLGKREFVLRYFNDVMQVSTELYLQMVKENTTQGKDGNK